MNRKHSNQPRYSIREVKGVICVHVEEDIVHESAITQFGDSLDQIVLEVDEPRLVVDFAGVNFLPTAMLGNLIAANTKLIGKGARLGISGANEQIRSLFEVTHLDTLFHFFDHIDDAIAGLESKLESDLE